MLSKLRSDLEKTPMIPYLQQIEEATKIQYEFFVIGGGLLVLFLLFFGVGAGIIWFIRSRCL